jgi:hypothetical protein
MKRLLCVLFLSLNVFTVGCTAPQVPIKIETLGSYSASLIKPLPLKVGIYYDDEFSTFASIVQGSNVGAGGAIYNIQTGKANVDLFNYILSSLFEKVIPLQYLPNDSDPVKDVDLILKPSVTNYTYLINYGSSTPFRTKIEYNVIFYMPNGEQICSRNIEGQAMKVNTKLIEFNNEMTSATKLTQSAMLEVATKFITGFCNQEQLKELFKEQCSQ